MNEKLKELISNAISGKLANFEIKEGTDNGTFTTIITSEAVDRDGEIVKLDGWDFENYLKNPVVLRWHEYYNLPVAKCTSLEMKDGKVIAKGLFASAEANPKAQQIRKLYDEGFINAVSVGFRVLQRNPENRRIIEKQELLEFSRVSVPANQEALGMGKGAKCIIETDIMGKDADNDIHYMTYLLKEVDEETTEETTPETTPEVTPETTPETGDDKLTLSDVLKAVKALNDKVDAVVADGNAKDKGTNFLSKEVLQSINRLSADALRDLKQS